MLQDLKKEKPWAILKVTRREYEATRPWKEAGISRARFEELLALMPDGFVDHCHREADADALVKAMFGDEA